MNMGDTLSQSIVVLADLEVRDGVETPSQASAQAITAARSLTDAHVDVVVTHEPTHLDPFAALGVSRIFTLGLDAEAARVGIRVADGLYACVNEGDYAAVFLTSSYLGREIAARVATMLRWGAVMDATSVSVRDGHVEGEKTTLAGTWRTRVRVESPGAIIALRASAVDAENAPSVTEPSVERIEYVPSSAAQAVEVVSTQAQEVSGEISLSDASTVVVGGRGVEGDFSLVTQLAETLGGAVGATRVATDEGWVSHAKQIGQTGVSISPNLYVGLGVSGAIHHTVGMQSAAHIVAVNDDPDAPIFEIADFGVVGDLNEVIPSALEEIERLRSLQ